MRLLLAEDEKSLSKAIAEILRKNNYSVDAVYDGEEAISYLECGSYDGVILDVMMPKADGITVLKKMRASGNMTPVLILTAKSEIDDKVLGLDSGADDYVSKPFGTMELISRIKALLRRTGNDDEPAEYRRGSLYVCPSKHIVRVDDKDVTLTLKEFELLCFLFKNNGMVLTRDEILSHIWGYEFDGESRTVDVHIRTLRSKLGDAGKYIETVRGIGYKMGGRDE